MCMVGISLFFRSEQITALDEFIRVLGNISFQCLNLWNGKVAFAACFVNQNVGIDILPDLFLLDFERIGIMKIRNIRKFRKYIVKNGEH